MSLMTPAELEQSVNTLGASLAQILADLERLKARHAAARARLIHHQHDFTRDLTGMPATYPVETHTHNYATVGHDHDGSYSVLGHTHPYASDTHLHTYQDYQMLKSTQNTDVSRTTGGPI